MQQIYILLCGFQSTNSDRFSGDGYEDPPVPISNTVVKLINAESTWLETAWEDRKPLIDVKAHLRVCLFCVWLPILPGYLVSRAVEEGEATRRMGSTHHLFPNVSCTELRSSEGKSTMSIDRNLSLVVEKMIFFYTSIFLILLLKIWYSHCVCK